MKKIILIILASILIGCNHRIPVYTESEDEIYDVQYNLDVFANGDGYVIVNVGNQMVTFRGSYDCNVQSNDFIDDYPNLDSILINPNVYTEQEFSDAKFLNDCIGIMDSYGPYYVSVDGYICINKRCYSVHRKYHNSFNY